MKDTNKGLLRTEIMIEQQEHIAPMTDWKWMKLAEVGKIISGGTPSTAVPEYWNGNINWVSPADLTGYKKKYITKGAKSITKAGLKNSSAKLMPKGSVLFSSRAPIGYVAITASELATNQGFKSIIPRDGIDKEYLYYFLKASKQVAEKAASGTTFKEISLSKFSELIIPIPPKPVQQAIVFKLEELFSELDKGIENLRLAQQQLKAYRHSIWKSAFEGKLTNTGEKVPKTGNKLTELSLKEFEKLPMAAEEHAEYRKKLMKEWKVKKLGDISEMSLGKMLDKQKNKGTLRPYLGNINVRWGSFQMDTLKLMAFKEDELEKYCLKKNDLVICEGGEPGRCAIWKDEKSTVMIQKALHRVRVLDSVDVRYVYHYLAFSASTHNLDKYFTGTTIKHLTGKELKKIQMPVPPIREQEKIVEEIESRFIVADKMEESINQSLQQAEALRQSILKKAFEGKLI